MVQEDRAKPAARFPPNSRSFKPTQVTKPQTVSGKEPTMETKSHSRPSKHKHDTAWTERRACLAKWSAVKASNSPDGRADKLNQDLV